MSCGEYSGGEIRAATEAHKKATSLSLKGVKEVSLKEEILGRHEIRNFLAIDAQCFMFYCEACSSTREKMRGNVGNNGLA